MASSQAMKQSSLDLNHLHIAGRVVETKAKW